MLKNFSQLLIVLSIGLMGSTAMGMSSGVGTYQGYLSSGGDWQLFITTKDITLQEAYDNCLLNAQKNPSRGFLCKFNGRIISHVPKKGTYRLYFSSGASGTTKDITRGEAYKNCVRNAEANPKQHVYCTLNHNLIYSNR